ncbi:hypothetical protein MbovWib_01885 [Mycoplasmopsis bovis]|uniref:Mbov_0396 family ICE element transmembrane protein n=1 Tax=Mycoplasmopsis bovis TaxID=28903 RepID=UPI0027A852FC
MFTQLLYAIFIAVYTIFVRLPLILIDLAAKTYTLISTSLPQYLMFGIKPGQSFTDAQLPTLFLRLTIISVFVFAILFILSAVRVQFQKRDEVSPISVAMKRSLLGVLIIIGIPILLYLFTMIINILMNLILGGEGVSIGQSIFESLYDKTWAAKGLSFTTWKQSDPEMGSFHISYSTYKKLPDGSPGQILFMGAFLGFGTLVPLGMGLIVLVTKVFQQFFLFIISPFIVSASVADDGKRMKQWMEMYAAKAYAILGMLIGMQMLVVWTTKSVGWANTLNMNYFVRFILMVGLIIGGAVSVSSLTDIVASFAGESASAKEALASTKASLKGGIALAAGGFGAVTAAKTVGKFARNNALTKGVQGIMGKSAGGRQFLENADSKRRIKQAFKDGKIGLAERNEKLNELKGQMQTGKVNKMKLREQKEKDLMLKSGVSSTPSQTSPSVGPNTNTGSQPVAETNTNIATGNNGSNASPSLSTAPSIENIASNNSSSDSASISEVPSTSASAPVSAATGASSPAASASTNATDDSYLNNLSKKDIKSSAFENGKEMEKSAKEALRRDKQEIRLDSKLAKTKKKLNSITDPKEINKANEKIKKIEDKLAKTKNKKEVAIQRAQDLDKLQNSRLKFYSKEQQSVLKTNNTVSNTNGNVTAYKFKKLIEKENIKGGK